MLAFVRKMFSPADSGGYLGFWHFLRPCIEVKRSLFVECVREATLMNLAAIALL
jgi:hypothetical protein